MHWNMQVPSDKPGKANTSLVSLIVKVDDTIQTELKEKKLIWKSYRYFFFIITNYTKNKFFNS